MLKEFWMSHIGFTSKEVPGTGSFLEWTNRVRKVKMGLMILKKRRMIKRFKNLLYKLFSLPRGMFINSSDVSWSKFLISEVVWNIFFKLTNIFYIRYYMTPEGLFAFMLTWAENSRELSWKPFLCHMFVRKLSNFIFPGITQPMFIKLDTNHPWVEEMQVCRNEG